MADPIGLRAHFLDEGYVVVRDAVPKAWCEAAKAAFAREVKPSRAYFKRHASSDFERHVFTEAGFMKYPIMNIQDLPEAEYGTFRSLGLALLAHASVQGRHGPPARRARADDPHHVLRRQPEDLGAPRQPLYRRRRRPGG